jgi:ATP-dependent Clp protease ATP-binding subunit ClpX
MTNKIKTIMRCSFCEKTQNEVKKLVAGNSGYICDECIILCNDVIRDEVPNSVSRHKLPTPKEIYHHLDSYVIGQDLSKLVLSVAVYNHYKRLTNKSEVEIEKSNVLLIGPTGSGKTLLAKTIAKFLDVPFAITDATTLTEAGYVGEDVENVVHKLYQAADQNIERTETGIIYIDEIDKKGRKSESTSITRDVSGEGVQQALLKIIEGTECRMPMGGGRKHPNNEMLTVNTKNILFILGGAFVGIEDIINKRVNNGSSIGFNADTERSKVNLSHVIHDDIIKWGIIPELAGRMPNIAVLEELNEEQLIRAMTEPKNSIVSQYQALFRMDNVDLEIESAACASIARRCIELKLGARGLRAELENALLKTQFVLPDLATENVTKVTITEETVTKGKEPILVYGTKRKKTREQNSS